MRIQREIRVRIPWTVRGVSLEVLTGIGFFFYVVLGGLAQWHVPEAWQKWPPVVIMAAVAVFGAASLAFYIGTLSQRGRLARYAWALLGSALAIQGGYEWLSMGQIVGDEDFFVILLTLVSVFAGYVLLHVEDVSTTTRNIWIAAATIQCFATITDATDQGLSIAGGAPWTSLGAIADFLDLIWTPSYAVAMVSLAFEIGRLACSIPLRTNHKTIWALTNGRSGDLAQMKVLAESLGWETEVKNVHLKANIRLNIAALSPFLVDQDSFDVFRPPFPHIVITAEAPLSPVARWIKELSGGETRIVHIGRPTGSSSQLDLVLTTGQFEIPAADNVINLPLPLSPVQCESFRSIGPDIRRLDSLPRPLVGVLVGGESPPFRFDRSEAERLRLRCEKLASELGGSCVLVTSPRSGREVECGIGNHLDVPGVVFRWGVDQKDNNLYSELLQTADRFVVTTDSISMISDAVCTGRPVYLYDLPQEPKLADVFGSAIIRQAERSKLMRYFNPIFWLYRLGVIYLPADKVELIRSIRQAGMVQEWPATEIGLCGADEIGRIVARHLFD